MIIAVVSISKAEVAATETEEEEEAAAAAATEEGAEPEVAKKGKEEGEAG